MALAAMVLVTATAAGCGERGGVRATSQATPPAPPCAPAPVAATTAAPAAATTAAPVASAPSATPSAKPADKPEPRKASLGGDDLLTVKRFVLAQSVKDREPVSAGTSFKSDANKIYAFVEVENRGRAPGEIVVEFEPPGGGAPHGDVTLAVGSASRWRTWAYTRTAHTPGSWTAVVKNRKGDVLARAPFEVTL
jgi:hypothetical protein